MQGSGSQTKKGVQFSLATKFTPGIPPNVQAEERPPLLVGGVDPASRPAGLTLRSSVTFATSNSSPVPVPVESKGGANASRNPVRSTLLWRPAPLLCKRLNVPVSTTSSVKWVAKADPRTGHRKAGIAQQKLFGPSGKFVADSSAADQPKVRCLLAAVACYPISSTE